jgi:hypothetical protein
LVVFQKSQILKIIFFAKNTVYYSSASWKSFRARFLEPARYMLCFFLSLIKKYIEYRHSKAFNPLLCCCYVSARYSRT